ncbi:MAG: FCD domain-containing protein [Alphaproteobacteria bacterium]|nr:FCD domain-containing protein [Alphaproteobacteria bacterium]
MRNTASQRIAETLSQDIDAGRFGTAMQSGLSAPPRFPTERDLAIRFGVARNTIRRAMDTLEASGRITREIGRGTFVTGVRSAAPPNDEISPDDLSDAPLMPPKRDVSPRDLIEARLMVEPAAAAAAALNATEADIALLMQAQTASTNTDIMEEFERQDAEIHRLLFAMTHNHVVQQMDALIRSLRDDADWLAAKRRAYSETLKARYVAQHAAIIEAVVKRSPKAAREAMTLHLEDVRRALMES